jgi:signal transduction histidine kinase
MHNQHPAARWSKGLKAAAGFILAVVLLLLINVTVYFKVRPVVESFREPQAERADELLRVLVVTDLFAVAFLSGLVLVLNRQLNLRDAVDRSVKAAHAEQTARLNEQVADLTRLNEALRAEGTERRRVAAQLRHFQKLETLGKLVGVVGHEFNNQLTIIIGYSEHLCQPGPYGSKDRELAAEIVKAGERAAELTRDLLGLVRSADTAARPLDLNEKVRQMRRLLGVLLGKQVGLETTLAANLPAIRAVPGQVEQALLNLAANARDAMPQGGTVSIETRALESDGEGGGAPPGRYVLLRVTDSGPGLSDEARSHLFEPFFTTKESGAGLGLATVREIVEGGGGRVTAENTAGQGATFRVYWPAAAERAPRSPERETVCQRAAGDRFTLSR